MGLKAYIVIFIIVLVFVNIFVFLYTRGENVFSLITDYINSLPEQYSFLKNPMITIPIFSLLLIVIVGFLLTKFGGSG